MAEIPLVYPDHVRFPRRYVIDGETRLLRRVELSQSSNATDDNDSPFNTPIVEEALPGSASVSELKLRGKSVLLTTSARMENPEILCLALSWTQEAVLESPIMVELDRRELKLRDLVKVQAFNEGDTLIRLVLVDLQGTFVVVTLTDKLLPQTESGAAQVLVPTDYIEEASVLQEISGSELQPSMVVFPFPNSAIVALSPFIMTVDIENSTSYIWSETQCLEDMRARSSSFGTLFSNVGDILLGRLEQGVMDMPPTAALCLSTTANPLFDSTYCITLHSDASIRKWMLGITSSPLPHEVTTLDSSKLPVASSWSDARNSVSLCARLYERSYALCVHIKTEGLYNEQDKGGSNCRLWVLHGSTQDPFSKNSSMSLAVPNEAITLVGMSFSPTAQRCTLSVLFQSVLENDRSNTIHLTYPPSIMSIVSPEPVIVGHGSLDKVASEERARIRSLAFAPGILSNSADASVDEALHELDSNYLKFLFRPMFPRGTGTVLPPSEECIRRALAKTVHGAKRDPGMSIELETVRTLYEWRNRENRQLVLRTTPSRENRGGLQDSKTATGPSKALSPFSVYEAYVHEDAENDGEQMDTEDKGEEDWERLEQERSTEMEAHEKRWRRLLLQVWEEEQLSRLPLNVQWLGSLPLQVIIRAGITSVADDRPCTDQEQSGDWGGRLDSIALKILSHVEQHKQKCATLYAVEQDLVSTVATAQLAVSDSPHQLGSRLEELARLSWAADEGEGEDIVSDEEHARLEDTVKELTPSQLVRWVEATPTQVSWGLPGLEVVGSDERNIVGKRVTWSQKQVANYQLRHSACGLAVRCVDSIRRLQLGRCLLLMDLLQGGQAKQAALRAYLHSLAVLWTSSQRVQMPQTFHSRKTVRVVEDPDSSSPPNKRLSFGDDASSILDTQSGQNTTALDVWLIDISQTLGGSSSVGSSPAAVPILLARSFFNYTFSGRDDIPLGKPCMLPELGALPPPKDETIATDYPRLALRLLAPYTAFSLPEDSADVVVARKESLAECLLIESHSKTASPSAKSAMRQKACQLLVPKQPNHDDAVDQRMIQTAISALTSQGKSMHTASVTKEGLVMLLEQIVPTGTSIEIQRLAELGTVKTLFAPLAAGVVTDIDSITQASIGLVAGIMLHLSRILYRLTILERHAHTGGADDKQSTDVLLDFISRAINEMEKTFSEVACRGMPEYGKMWNRFFNHAVQGGQWKQARQSCMKNPKLEFRESGFRRLVRSMVDQGALGELLEMCTDLVEPDTSKEAETIDLYEIAQEILLDAISPDVYTLKAAAREPTALSDFHGALYALHASRSQWRRAAQSMDLRFRNARDAMNQEFGFNVQSAELRERLIVEDIVLGSIGALASIELVKEASHRFLVSGECGQYHSVSIEGTGAEELQDTRMKRARGGPVSDSDEGGVEEEDRLSRFMTEVELEGRAIRNIALRTLYFDSGAESSFAKSAFLREIHSAKLDIDHLFKRGYYRHGLLLANMWGKNRSVLAGSSRPGGRDLFYDSMCHLLGEYLVPASFVHAIDTERPKLRQLLTTLDDIVSNNGIGPCLVLEKTPLISDAHPSALKRASNALVRHLTLAYSKVDSPIAQDVASFFLDHADSTQMPAWLERLLVGADVPNSAGLFARRSSSGSNAYMGDAAALVSMYMKRGMLVEACNVVTRTLTGFEGEGKESQASRAVARLPENGDIDFVPYDTIDLVWNLVDVSLSKGVLGPTESKRMVKSRDQMQAALEQHFALMQMSEAGMRSARALRQIESNA